MLTFMGMWSRREERIKRVVMLMTLIALIVTAVICYLKVIKQLGT